MTDHILFFSESFSPERLSLLNGIFRAWSGSPEAAASTCTVFLTGDALYSLREAGEQQIWMAILSHPEMMVICDTAAMALRGFPEGWLADQYPVQVTGKKIAGPRSGMTFWAEVIDCLGTAGQGRPDTVGWLEIDSPYMHSTPGIGIRLLSAALEAGSGISLFACLDGCHICHVAQKPEECENIGAELEALGKKALDKDLPCTVFLDRESVGARGYATWDDGQGATISLFAQRSAHIRDLDTLAREINTLPALLAGNAGCCFFSARPERPGIPPVLILITHSPYRTSHAYGGLALAAALAHQGASIHVVFCGDGCFALAGDHQPGPDPAFYVIPDLVRLLSTTPQIRFSAFTPSLQKRGLSKNPALAAVTDIDYPEFSRLCFAPSGTVGRSQRILFF